MDMWYIISTFALIIAVHVHVAASDRYHQAYESSSNTMNSFIVVQFRAGGVIIGNTHIAKANDQHNPKQTTEHFLCLPNNDCRIL